MPRYLPSENERLLLQAALQPPEAALQAWKAWLARNDLDDTRKAALDLYPAIYRNIGSLLTDGHARGTLHGVYRRSWLQNQVNLNRASSVIAKLRAEGIDSLVLKGAALVESVYKDPGARSMADVDVLVPTMHAERAYELLLADGWAGERDHRGDMAHAVQVIRSVDLMKPDGTRLDLH